MRVHHHQVVDGSLDNVSIICRPKGAEEWQSKGWRLCVSLPMIDGVCASCLSEKEIVMLAGQLEIGRPRMPGRSNSYLNNLGITNLPLVIFFCTRMVS